MLFFCKSGLCLKVFGLLSWGHMRISVTEKDKQRLAQAGVLTLYLFGSRASGHESAMSDFDFAVILEDPEILRQVAEKQRRYLALYDILTDVIGRQTTEPVVDIVFLQEDVSLELKAHVIKHGVLLFDREPNVRANLEAFIMERAADFAPLLREMDDVILRRI